MLANRMMTDVASVVPKLAKTQSNGGAAPISSAPKEVTQTPIPVPLNAANLQQQQQALKQQQAKAHNRQGSRSGPPAAPTSAQPPFPFGSPTQGISAEQLPKTLTRDQLRLPPTKKQRQSASSTPVLGQQSSASATPTIKAGSPGKAGKMAEPRQTEKVLLRCPEPSCAHLGDGFETAEALGKHRTEEHVLILDNPMQFALGELSTMLTLDTDGIPQRAIVSEATGPQNMATSTSQPGQVSNIKTEGTPAASSTPLNRQASTAGVKASPAAPKNAKSTKPDETASQQIKVTKASDAKPVENLWDYASVNPQDLQANFKQMETGAGGAISDMNVWRAITPNDTPESSKDGVSEPNSDITEGLDLNINLDIDFPFSNDWHPFGLGDDLLDFTKMDVNSDLTDLLMMDDDTTNNATNFGSWNEFIDQSNFDKPFVHDTSLYSMNLE